MSKIYNFQEFIEKNENIITEGWKDIVASGIIGAASLIPMKSSGQIFNKDM